MLAVVSVGVVAAVMTIAASVIYFDSLGDIALHREISADTGANHDIVITGREVGVEAASHTETLELVEESITSIALSIVTGLTLAYGSPTLLVEETESDGNEIDASLRAVLVNSPKLQAKSILTAGSWPSNAVSEDASGQLVIDVAVEETAATEFKISVGETIVVAPFWDDLNDSFSVRVSGTFARGQADPDYWRDLDGEFGLDDTDLNFLTLVTDSDVFVSKVAPYLPGMTVRYFWRFHVDSGRVKASGAKKLLLGFDEI